MSIADKIERLQTAKTSIANAITNKGGTVTAGDGFEDFASDIATIPAGVGGYTGTPTFISFRGQTDITSADISGLDTSKLSRMDYMFYGCTNLTSISGLSGLSIKSLSNAFYSCSSITSIDLSDVDLSQCTEWGLAFLSCSEVVAINFGGQSVKGGTSYSSTFSGCSKLQTINAIIDFSLVTGDYGISSTFTSCSKLANVGFKPNSIKVNFQFSTSSYLSDATLVSLANALMASASKTLTLHATPKARVASIMGYVDQGSFESSRQGIVSLQDYIVNIKGWTLG